MLWEVSFGFWVTWSISSWQENYKSVFFPKTDWWIVELIFLSLNNSGLIFLQNECPQSSQIYLSPEKLRKLFTFQSCKFLNCKIDQSNNFAKLPITMAFLYNFGVIYTQSFLTQDSKPECLWHEKDKKLNSWLNSQLKTPKYILENYFEILLL